MPVDSGARYLRWMFAALILIVGLVGIFNAVIDPLAVIGAPRIAGLNAMKPHLDHDRELSRWTAARRLCPSAGIFGNSRAEIGLDPDNPVFAAQGLSAFNHAIPGTGAGMTYRQLDWLRAAHCMPKTIILGVEFFDFLGGAKPHPLPTPQSNPPPGLDARFLGESVFSLTALVDSIDTILLQRARYPKTVTERGFNPLQNYVGEVEQSGHYVLFRQRAEENVKRWRALPALLRPAEGGMSDDEQVVDAIVTQAAQAGSSVYIVIYPYHAEIRLMLERLGLGELFSDWKRLILAIADRHRGGAGKIEVWDFSGVGPETSEAIPVRGDRHTQMSHYWEAGHFKKALGDKMIDRVFGARGGFGIKLDDAHIEVWLSADRARALALASTPSPLLTEVDDVLAQRAKR